MRYKSGGWPYSQAPNVEFELNLSLPIFDGLIFALPMFGPRVVGTQRFVDRVQGRTLTSFNGPAWVSDPTYGHSLLFDNASTQYLEAPSIPFSAPPYTLAAWANSDDDTTDQAVIGLADRDAGAHNILLMFDGGAVGDPVEFNLQAGGATHTAATTTGYTANTDHHLCAIAYAVDSRAVFIDGGSKGTNAANAAPAGIDSIAIGRENDTSPRRYMSGLVREVFMWIRALADSEVKWLADPRHRWELYRPRIPRLYGSVVGAPPVGAIMNQIQFANLGADLYNGTLI